MGGGRSSNTNIAPRLYVQFEHSLLVLKVKYYACRIYFQENIRNAYKSLMESVNKVGITWIVPKKEKILVKTNRHLEKNL